MAESEARRKTFYLFDEDLEIISTAATRYRLTDSAALRVILTDWAKADSEPARTLVDTGMEYRADRPGSYVTAQIPDPQGG